LKERPPIDGWGTHSIKKKRTPLPPAASGQSSEKKKRVDAHPLKKKRKKKEEVPPRRVRIKFLGKEGRKEFLPPKKGKRTKFDPARPDNQLKTEGGDARLGCNSWERKKEKKVASFPWGRCWRRKKEDKKRIILLKRRVHVLRKKEGREKAWGSRKHK